MNKIFTLEDMMRDGNKAFICGVILGHYGFAKSNPTVLPSPNNLRKLAEYMFSQYGDDLSFYIQQCEPSELKDQ